MQRRVAAIYLVFFVVLGASAYSVIALAEQPSVNVQSGDTYENGSAFSVAEERYTVSVSLEESEGGGHGGGGGASAVGSLSYVNESARQTAAWENNGTVTYLGADYDVHIDNSSSPAQVRLVESVNVEAALQNDSAVYNETVVIDGTESVTYREDNRNQPLDEYLDERFDRRTFTFTEGDTVEYEGESTTLVSITSSEATLEWTASATESIELAEGENVTLADGNQYFAYFTTHGEEDPTVTIVPTDDYGAYANDLARQDNFHERTNGLWGIVILSSVVALLVISMAYMPVKG